jgi:hypothetical protein
MRRNLTAKLIENLKPATDRRYEVRDALLPGFGIRVSVSGGKSWFVVARVDGRWTTGQAYLGNVSYRHAKRSS